MNSERGERLANTRDPTAAGSSESPIAPLLAPCSVLPDPLRGYPASPLSGRVVLVTRPGEQAQELRELLAALGAKVLEQPGITVSDPPDWLPVDTALDHVASYDWLVFSSSNGVKRLLDRLVLRGGSLRQLATVKLAAIGPGTAAELVRYGLKAEVVPEEYRAESLADALTPYAAGTRFLLARASRGRQVLPERLIAAGGVVEQVVVYSTNDVETADPQVAAALTAGRVDWVTVTSSAIARSIVGLFGEQLRKARLASISPVTSQILGELGYPPAVEATEYTMAGLAAAIAASLGVQPRSG
ncbi:MAG: uroporphyrinogen-III synthase [Thermoguttaceae bacterium]